MILEVLWLGGGVAMTFAPLLFIILYTRSVDWRNPISQNVMAMAASVFLFGAASLLIRAGVVPTDWSRPLLVAVNWGVALVFAWRITQLWQVTHSGPPTRSQETHGNE